MGENLPSIFCPLKPKNLLTVLQTGQVSVRQDTSATPDLSSHVQDLHRPSVQLSPIYNKKTGYYHIYPNYLDNISFPY